MWDNQSAIDISDSKQISRYQNYMCQNLRDQFLQQSSEKMENETKLFLFKDAKNTLSPSKYLSTLTNRNERSLFAKLRLGVLPLEIEKGRRKNIARESRFCKICNLNVVENEMHFLFDCPTLDRFRSKHFTSLTTILPNFRDLSNNQKIKLLYFSENSSQCRIYVI